MLFSLALIPVIGLLLMIYFNDKKEKEPFGLLVGLFFGGVGSVVTALIGEEIGGLIIPEDTLVGGILHAMIVVGPSEELSKFLVLFLITWKNRHFNYSYDAIVYAVFVSLGFAAIENIGYVFIFGAGTGLVRMFTSVPGHACFSVFMGFFYSKAKYAQVTKNKGKCALFIILSMFVPIILHGIFDAILMGGNATQEISLIGMTLVLWICYMAAMFAVSIVLIVKSSKNDFCIVDVPEKNEQTIYIPNVVGTWTCTCGSVNYLNYCGKCGRQRQTISSWYCPNCWTLSAYNFCGKCGCPKPVDQTQPFAQQPYAQQPYSQPGNPYL